VIDSLRFKSMEQRLCDMYNMWTGGGGDREEKRGAEKGGMRRVRTLDPLLDRFTAFFNSLCSSPITAITSEMYEKQWRAEDIRFVDKKL
jgi:hypothetical protein